jgi:hypothetical protein
MTPADDKKPQAITPLPKDSASSAAEFGQLVSKLTRLGIRGQDLAAIIQQSKTRSENADALRKWLKNRPKAK